jgi:hypothetical protein
VARRSVAQRGHAVAIDVLGLDQDEVHALPMRNRSLPPYRNLPSTLGKIPQRADPISQESS